MHNSREGARLLGHVMLNPSLKCMLGRPYKKRNSQNKPFPSFPRPLYQNKVKCSAFDMEMVFHPYVNKTFSQERLCIWPHFEREGGFWNLEVVYRGINRDGHS